MTLLQHPVGSGFLHTPSQEYPPNPRVSGRKRKAAAYKEAHGQILRGEIQGPPEWLQFRQHPLDSQPHEVPFWCDLCKLNCVTHHNLKIHMHGKKHKAKCDELSSPSFKPRVKSDEISSQSRQQRPQIPTVWCDLCKVNCMNSQNLKRHLQGKKHRAKWDKPNLDDSNLEDCGEKQQAEFFQMTPVWCTLCKLNCLNSGNLKRHLQGKKHRAKWDEQPLQAYSSQDQQQPVEIQRTAGLV